MGHCNVEAQGLTKVYKMGENEVWALQGVDLQVEPGGFVSIMGRSGSVKSTLLHILGCLDKPSAGKVYIDGEEVSALPPRELPRVRREKVGFLFQQHNLIPSLTALENVALPMKYARKPRAEAPRRALELLEWVGLANRAHHLPAELSGGERARVALARALANDPPVVLADEPTGTLDSHTAAEVVALMRRLNQETGKTLIVVTHDRLVAERTDRIYHVLDGRITEVEQLVASQPAADVEMVVRDGRCSVSGRLQGGRDG